MMNTMDMDCYDSKQCPGGDCNDCQFFEDMVLTKDKLLDFIIRHWTYSGEAWHITFPKIFIESELPDGAHVDCRYSTTVWFDSKDEAVSALKNFIAYGTLKKAAE